MSLKFLESHYLIIYIGHFIILVWYGYIEFIMLSSLILGLEGPDSNRITRLSFYDLHAVLLTSSPFHSIQPFCSNSAPRPSSSSSFFFILHWLFSFSPRHSPLFLSLLSALAAAFPSPFPLSRPPLYSRIFPALSLF